MMGGFMGIFAIIFGIFWTGAASSMNAPFAIFGIVFILFGVVYTVIHFKNAIGKNRFSMFDITGREEEVDPFDERIGYSEPRSSNSKARSSFCPYCGSSAQRDFEFCKKCGKRLP